jgi:hypothetical protein
MPADQSSPIHVIERATGLRVNSHKVLDSLAGNLTLEVNDAWMS